MSSVPPPPNSGFAQYPRAQHGSVEKLDKLVEGYFGLNKAVFANLGMCLGLNILSQIMVKSNSQAALLILPLLLVIPVALFFISKPQVAKIGEGLDWAPGTVNSYCVLIALFFWFCFGVIGFGLVQNKAMEGLKSFGFQGSGLFTGKKKIMTFVEQYRAQASSVRPPPSMSL